MKTRTEAEKIQMCLAIEKDVRRALKRESAETDRTMNEIVNEALRESLRRRIKPEKQTA